MLESAPRTSRPRTSRPRNSRPRTRLAVALSAVLTLLASTVAGTDSAFASQGAAAVVISGTWTSVPDTASSRYAHGSTLLNDGRVFVVGRDFSSFPQGPWIEIYNPQTNTWDVPIPESRATFGVTPVVLNDGRVLIASGRTGISINNGTRTVEIFNPQTGTMEQTGMTNRWRWQYAATVLTDGRVFIAGGTRGITATGSSAEIYDPHTGLWSLTPDMSEPRWTPKSVLLDDGRVLVVGGGTAEIYNPGTNTWSPGGALAAFTGTENFELVRLSDGQIFLNGGGGSNGTQMQAYNQQTNTWTTVAPMHVARSFHTATVFADDTILVVGGHELEANRTAEIYDPLTNTWTLTGNLIRRRDWHDATLMSDGRVLVTGSQPTLAEGRSAEIYTP